MNMCEIKQKEVINTCTCKKIGYVTDMEFDLCTGCIINIIVTENGKLSNIFSGKDCKYVVPLKCIKQVGADIILVQINE